MTALCTEVVTAVWEDFLTLRQIRSRIVMNEEEGSVFINSLTVAESVSFDPPPPHTHTHTPSVFVLLCLSVCLSVWRRHAHPPTYIQFGLS